MSGLMCVGFIARGLLLPPALLIAAGSALAQYSVDPSGRAFGSPPQPQQPAVEDKYLKVPLVNNIPGGIAPEAKLDNPMANDPASADRGMYYFNSFNCIGCHAPNGGGGMGPSLSKHAFKYGDEPANHFVVIAHGAPLGMPAWAGRLSENVIWDLVSYIDNISNAPRDEWGTTFSPAANLPRIEQVPAEFNQTTKPWLAIQPFSAGDASSKSK
jgi:cytochrome c oxidase cbb3-type subunit III